MLVRPAVVIVASVTALAVLTPEASAATRTFRGHWKLDDKKGAVAHDSSGHHHDGRDFHIQRKSGRGYAFNGTSSRVIVPNARSLNPRNKAFSFRARLKMHDPPRPVGDSYDVLRKGLVTSRGGDYKLEIENVRGKALAHCVVRSVRKDHTRVLASIYGTTDLADGKFHTVTCSKTSTRLMLAVDSLPTRTDIPQGGLGSVSNAFDLGLGAKAEKSPKTGFDWFDGVLDNAWVASP